MFRSVFLRSICVLAAALGFALLAMPKDKTPPAKPDYSKEAAVIEEYHMAYRFEDGGSYTQDGTAKIRVQSQAGVQEYGVLVFTYSSAIERMAIDYVRVRQPDGTVVVTPPSGVEDVTPQVTVAAPEYSDERQKHVAVKGLVPGSELEYHVHSHVSPLVPGQFWLSYDFTNNAIMLDEELEVNVPADRAVKVKSAKIQPVITQEGNRRIYLWKSSNLKEEKLPLYPVGQLPPPDVLLSSFQSWAEVGRWWASLEKPQMAPTPAVRAKAADLTKGLTTEEQKLKALYTYVAQQFRYISISFGIGRYEPHLAGDILANGYGDCKDKHTLLASLLSAAGITAYPALINSVRKVDPDVPSPGQFDHVITVVPEGQKLVWMDTTTELAPLSLLTFNLRNKQALVIPDGEPSYLATTPAQPPVKNLAEIEADGGLSNDGTFSGKMKFSGQGDTALVFQLIFRSVPRAQWKDLVQGISNREGYGGTVSNVIASTPEDTSQPFTYSYDYVRKDYSNWRDHQITAPLPPMGLPPASDDKEEAGQPIVLGAPVEVRYHARIDLPKGLNPTLPADVSLSKPYAEYHDTYTFKDGVLDVERDLTVKAAEVAAAQREDYSDFQRAVSNDEFQYVALNAGGVTIQQAMQNPDFRQALQEAQSYWRNGDNHAAVDAIQRATKLVPNSEDAWMLAGWLYQLVHQTDDAVSAMRKAIAIAPQDPRPYRQLVSTLTAARRPEEAVQVWRDFVQANPQNGDAHAALGAALAQNKEYADAAAEYQEALKLDPKNWGDEIGLGLSYAEAGKTGLAVAAYEQAARINPTPPVWNDVGYDMADHNLDLPEAGRFVKMAVQAEESDAANVNLDKLEDKDLVPTNNLPFYWDSLGWVYYREGRLKEAREFVAASWDLGQDPTVADHLGQIDEKLENKEAAIRDYAASLAASPSPIRILGPSAQPPTAPPSPAASDARTRLDRLVGSAHAEDEINQARDRLSHERSYNINKAGMKPGSADFFVLIGAGGKPLGIKFLGGSDDLRSAAKKIAALHFRQVFPDNAPTKLLRRGMLSCSEYTPTCTFVLLLPGDVHSVN